MDPGPRLGAECRGIRVPRSPTKEERMRDRFVLTLAAGLLLTALVFGPSPSAAQAVDEGARVGTWKTWVLSSGTEIAVPAPPADNSDQTKKELDELRQLQAQRSEITD